MACFLLTTVVGVGLDLYAKSWAYRVLAPEGLVVIDGHRRTKIVDESRQEYVFIHGFINFRFVPNEGAVFGIGQGQRPVFILVSALAIGFIFYLFATSGAHHFYQFVLGLLLAGVLGNLYDRVVLQYVRDMIYIFPHRILWGSGGHREVFPWIFNIADSLLCVGVALIFLYSLKGIIWPEAEPGRQT